jgi:nicotinate phosphoribosyltransferase
MEEGYPLYCGDKSRRIIPNIQELLEKELAQGSKVFFLCDQHDPDDLEFNMFPPHCIKGSTETEVVPELSKYPGEIVPKTRFSCFLRTNLQEELNKIEPEVLVVCGVCTDICVLHTVGDVRDRDYMVEVPVDCVASFNDNAHIFALEHMEKVLGANLTRAVQNKVPQPRFKIADNILSGNTTDIYFARTVEILKKEGMNPVTTMEVFPTREGVLCGIEEVRTLLEEVLPEDNREVWALPEGENFRRKEVILRITAPYQAYGVYETVYLGMLANSSGWATAARQCVDAALSVPVISFGARHVHPSVAGVMEYSAIVGGCLGCASISGAELAGIQPSGTIPHALIIITGDTAKATILFDKYMPSDVPRIALVDTFRDEPEESVLVAQAMSGKLQGVRLDTPAERGGVTADLVKETRAKLDLAGFREVKIFVSGGITPEKIKYYLEEGAPVDFFGVGSYISGAKPVDFTADIHVVDDKPIAKRGRIPGITINPRLKRIM